MFFYSLTVSQIAEVKILVKILIVELGKINKLIDYTMKHTEEFTLPQCEFTFTKHTKEQKVLQNLNVI